MSKNVLPPELVLSVAEHCPLSLLCCLVRLDQKCWRIILPQLYKRISLLSYKQALSFCDTICWGTETLREHPLTLDIHLSSELGNPVPSNFDRTLRMMLGNLDSLKYLSLNLPHNEAFLSIFQPKITYSFSLRALFLQAWLAEYSVEFVDQQVNIEELVLNSESNVASDVTHTDFVDNLAVGALPRLHHLGIGLPHHVELVKNRPTYSIEICGLMSLGELWVVIDSLNAASVPLTRLRILHTFLYQVNCDTILNELLTMISFCQKSLVDLTIDFKETTGSAHQRNELESLIDIERLQLHLSHFAALQQFRYKDWANFSNQLMLAEYKATMRNPTTIQSWKSACPGLRHLVLFDILVYG